jgi:rhamnose transport system ATP-binding protein
MIRAGHAQPDSRPPVMELQAVSKQFGGTVVVDQVDLVLMPGRIHGLCGENGAGKSTLVKMMAAVHQPDAGTILMDGEVVRFGSPIEAQARGVAVIHQHPTLFGNLSVAENIFLPDLPLKGLRRVNRAEIGRRSAELLGDLGVEISPESLIEDLSVADRQMVAVAKALARDARVLIMDEPTATLATTEVDRLFGIVRRLRDSGVAILMVNHRMDEVFSLSDEITVLRDGTRIFAKPASDLSPDDVIRGMIGRELGQESYQPPTNQLGDPLLEVSNASRAGAFTGIDFTIRGGEILGMAGLVGSGRTEIARAIFGADAMDEGVVSVSGTPVSLHSPRDAIAAGIAYVAEDRRGLSIAMELSVLHNLTISSLKELSRRLFINRDSEKKLADGHVSQLGMKLGSLSQAIGTLSGGNQQKVAISKWLATNPKVLILDEPTQGVDIGAKQDVHSLVRSLAEQGLAVLFISSDLPEIISIADRLLVISEGRIAAELERADITPEKIMQAAVSARSHQTPDDLGIGESR